MQDKETYLGFIDDSKPFKISSTYFVFCLVVLVRYLELKKRSTHSTLKLEKALSKILKSSLLVKSVLSLIAYIYLSVL